MKAVVGFLSLFFLLPFSMKAGSKSFASWAEIWSNHYLAYNNFSDNNQFFINTILARGGPRYFLSNKKIFTLSIDPFFEAEAVVDAFDSRHPNFYNNHGKLSPGIRIFLRQYHKDAVIQYIQTELYYKYLTLFNFSKVNPFELKKISTTDQVAGVKFWSNSSSYKKNFAYELWADLSYRKTNFGKVNENHYMILTVSPYFLMTPWLHPEWDTAPDNPSFYYNPDFVIDLLGEKYEFNRNPFSNRVINRLGIRYILRINLSGDNSNEESKNIHLLFYADYNYTCYIRNVSGWNLRKSDARAGLMLYIPFGNADFKNQFSKKP